MRALILFSALTVLAAAFPRPQEEATDEPAAASTPFATPTIPLVPSTSLNIPITIIPGLPTSLPESAPETSTSRRRPHSEPIPVFTKQCDCDLATVQYACWVTDALQKCHFEENFSYGCYMRAAGGCATPTRVCSNLFQPTPRSGRHPCELGPNPPLITGAPDVSLSLTSIPVLPTTNVTFPGLPSVNLTLPLASSTKG